MSECDTEIVVEIGDDAPNRLDKALALALPADVALSRTRIGNLIRAGAVTRNGVVEPKPHAKVCSGDVWTVKMPVPKNSTMDPENIDLKVLHEDDDLIVIDKHAGMVVHPARGNWTGTLVNALLYRCGESLKGIGDHARPGIVHRLDKDTSGVMVAAKSNRAMLGLSDQFKNHSVHRVYRAVVRGVPDRMSNYCGFSGISFESGNVTRIEGPIGRHVSNRHKRQVYGANCKHAVTRLVVRERLMSNLMSFVECRLETGRTHQIRVHLSHTGHPVVGDRLYGSSARVVPASAGEDVRQAVMEFSRQALHAAELGFDHPRTGRSMKFSAPLPEDMTRLLSLASGC